MAIPIELKRVFPQMNEGNSSATSPIDVKYNCIAWAAGIDNQWWWPDPTGIYYWPPGIPRAVTLEAYIKAFENIGYLCCENGILEEGYEKVVLYANPATEIPLHAARQLNDGTWTSKLGQHMDICHTDPEVLHGTKYGTASQYLKRHRNHDQ